MQFFLFLWNTIEAIIAGALIFVMFNPPEQYQVKATTYSYDTAPYMHPSATVALVSYADGGDKYLIKQLELNHSALDKGFDSFLNYRRKHLSQKFLQDFSHILNQSIGVGYWLWKPFCLLDAMRRLPEGAVIFYIDNEAIVKDDITPLTELALQNGRVFFSAEERNRVRTKRDCFILMGCDTPQYYNSSQILGGFIVLVNNPANRDFVAKWFEYCQDARILTDSPSQLANEFPDFEAHDHDQSILSLLVAQQSDKGVVLAAENLYKYTS